jgi:ADP-dependent NAD(P)H-hydrate dehydratase / NAD(P)H-hydrate epimerase
MVVTQRSISSYLVTTKQMQAIERRMFQAGMPIAALMEKVGILIAQKIQTFYPLAQYRTIGVLVGPGHNGGDALVVARELHYQGYAVILYRAAILAKELTEQHWQYTTTSLGLQVVTTPAELGASDAIVEGLFGFGLNRSIDPPLSQVITIVNGLKKPVISIDLPAGIHTDSGAVLGTAIQAAHTLCLGLWKMACVADEALPYLGQLELIDFQIPLPDIQAVLGVGGATERERRPQHQRVTQEFAADQLLQPRSPLAHKYQQGHLLLIVGSRQYAGAAILAGLGARATGVGMVSIAVPQSLQFLILQQLPEAVVIPCPETDRGAIGELPALDWSKYGAIACGCGLTKEPRAIIERLLVVEKPLVLDADGLNILAEIGLDRLHRRSATTVLTPHLGELRRLWPSLAPGSRLEVAQQAAALGKCIVLFKGARTVVAHPDGFTWSIGDSTPALARGGSGDVLTGLIGGLVAQGGNCFDWTAVAAWWQAAAAQAAVMDRGERGLEPGADYLRPFLAALSREKTRSTEAADGLRNI